MKPEQIKRLKMYGDWIMAIRDRDKMYGTLYLPDSASSRSPFSLVEKVGPKAHQAIKRGSTIISRGIDKNKKNSFRLDKNELFFMPGFHVEAIFIKGRVLPLGNRVLVKRRQDLSTVHLSNGICAEPQQWSKAQQLDCEVVQFGMPEGSPPKTLGLKIGDVCRLKAWEQNMFELSLNGEYHLIVDIDDIEFKV